MPENIARVRLDVTHLHKLDRLADLYNTTRSEIVRRLMIPRLELAIAVLDSHVDPLSGRSLTDHPTGLSIVDSHGDDETGTDR